MLVAAVVSVLFTSLVAAKNIHQPLGVPASHRALGLYRSPGDADLALRHRHLLQTDEFEKSSAHVASAPSYAVVAAQLTDAAYGCNTVTASIQLCGVASSLAAPSFQSCIAAALGMTSIQVARVVVTNIITSVAHDCPPPTEPEPDLGLRNTATFAIRLRLLYQLFWPLINPMLLQDIICFGHTTFNFHLASGLCRASVEHMASLH